MVLEYCQLFPDTVVCGVADYFPQQKIQWLRAVFCSVSLCAWKQGISLFSGCVPIRDTRLSENTLIFFQTGHLQKLCIR